MNITLDTSKECCSNDPWLVTMHLLPIPYSASITLQKELECLADKPNLETALHRCPKTIEQWKELQSTTNKVGRSIALELSSYFDVRLETLTMGDCRVFKLTPRDVSVDYLDTVFYHTHGGSYVFGAGLSATQEAILLAAKLQMVVYCVDYRLPPENPFPAGLDDVMTVYKALLTKYDSSSIIMGGTSAGGGIALAAVHKMKQDKLSLPKGLFIGTPWSDLSKTGDSYFTNQCADHVLVTYDGVLKGAVDLYLNNEYELDNPFVSPVYGDFSDFPPMFLVSGTRDLFLSNTVRIQALMKQNNRKVELLVLEGIAHGDYLNYKLPESELFYKELNKFIIEIVEEESQLMDL